VVDEDIDCRDPNAVNWALSFSMQPQRDIRIVNNRVPDLDPSAAPPGTPKAERRYPSPSGSSAILIDATRKWAYHPVALPKEEYMRQALKYWEEDGFPSLELRTPWYGYHLGSWGESEEENAQLMLSGDMALQGENQKKNNQVKIP
jgi:3-polyprenyl-4-hydroxybenzoate decarboxylase